MLDLSFDLQSFKLDLEVASCYEPVRASLFCSTFVHLVLCQARWQLAAASNHEAS